jgi:hypothetical protein
MECNKDRNKDFCNCTYPCSKAGICCDCLNYHRKMGELPACYFPVDAEKTYDRSIENFISLYQQRGAWW